MSNNKCTAHSTTSLEHKQNNNQMQQHMLERMHVPWMCYRNFCLIVIFVISSGGFSLLSWGNQRAEHQNPSLCRRSRCGHCKFHSVSSTHGSSQGPPLGQLRRKMIKMIFSKNTHSVICIAKILKHILHKWEGHIWPFHDDLRPQLITLTHRKQNPVFLGLCP